MSLTNYPDEDITNNHNLSTGIRTYEARDDNPSFSYDSMQKKIDSLEEIKQETLAKLQLDECIEAITIEPDEICNQLIQELEMKFSAEFRTTEAYEQIKEKIMSEVTAKCEEFTDIIKEIKFKQLQYYKGKIITVINEYEPKVIEKLGKSKQINISEILNLDEYKKLEKLCSKLIDNVNLSSSVYSDIKPKINDFKTKQFQKLSENIENSAQIVQEKNIKNIRNDLKSKAEEIIKSEITDLETNIMNESISQIYEYTIREVSKLIIETCKQKLWQQIHEQDTYSSVLNQFENEIFSEVINKYYDNIRSTLYKVKSIAINNIINLLQNKINNDIQEIEKDIYNNDNVRSFNEIYQIVSNKAKTIRDECISIISSKIEENNESLSVQIIAKYQEITALKDFIRLTLAASKEDTNSQRKILVKIIDALIEKEVEQQKSKVTNNPKLADDVFHQIKQKCENRINFIDFTDKSLKSEINNYLNDNLNTKKTNLKDEATKYIDKEVSYFKKIIDKYIQSNPSHSFYNIIPNIFSMRNDELKNLIRTELKNQNYCENETVKKHVDEYLMNELKKR